tara:strand:+ start:2056 stop:2625 length:570 start_codon:yes stop_codon:yes gene_type:complete
MSINITINRDVGLLASPEMPVQQEKKPVVATRELKVRKTLGGDLIIFDHRDIDIVVMPDKNKVVSFAKESYTDESYHSADRLFKYLTDKGIVQRDSVQGGNVYSSLEAKLEETKDYNTTQLALFTIANFIEEERPYLEFEDDIEEAYEERMTDPTPEESSEFDPRRHSTKKGSVRPELRPYGLYTNYVY